MAARKFLAAALRTGLRAVPPLRSVLHKLHDYVRPHTRDLRAMQRRHEGQVLQPYPTTCEDRYPEVFAALADHLADVAEPCILSYGCSDGSEVRSLRKWFPHAHIVGLDPNARMIAKARSHLARNPDEGISYIEAGSPDALGAMRFDAVLAMAVFRHGDLEASAPDTCEDILPFKRFAETVEALDDHIKPGGWLAVWNAHFRFSDLPIAANYRAQELPFAKDDPQVLLYGPENARIDGVTYAEVLFAKTLRA